jgi:hypothetical protein
MATMEAAVSQAKEVARKRDKAAAFRQAKRQPTVEASLALGVEALDDMKSLLCSELQVPFAFWIIHSSA